MLKYVSMKRLAPIIVGVLFIASSAHAQGIPTTIGGLSLSASINNPEPGQQVVITAQSYSADIDSSKITWVVNGAVAESGIGENTLTVTAPALGEHLSIAITMVAASGATVQDSIDIGSGAVDLIPETSGYVPPFFQGKLTPVYQNMIKITAIPHLADSSGVEYDPKTLVYEWKEDQSLIQDQSGYGKQSETVGGDLIPRSHDIDVTVSTRDGTAQAEAITTISFGSPSISFYVDDPLYGPLFNQAVRDTLRIGAQKETSRYWLFLSASISRPTAWAAWRSRGL